MELKYFYSILIKTGPTYSDVIIKITCVTYVVHHLKVIILLSLTWTFPYRCWHVLNPGPEYLVEVRLGKAFRHNLWHLQHCSESTSNSRVR
jgi:hypothetical protein